MNELKSPEHMFGHPMNELKTLRVHVWARWILEYVIDRTVLIYEVLGL